MPGKEWGHHAGNTARPSQQRTVDEGSGWGVLGPSLPGLQDDDQTWHCPEGK